MVKNCLAVLLGLWMIYGFAKVGWDRYQEKDMFVSDLKLDRFQLAFAYECKSKLHQHNKSFVPGPDQESANGNVCGCIASKIPAVELNSETAANRYARALERDFVSKGGGKDTEYLIYSHTQSDDVNRPEFRSASAQVGKAFGECVRYARVAKVGS